MYVDDDNLRALLLLQHLDIDLMRTKKAFDELPQRQAITQARAKKTEIEAKREQVSKMRKEAEAELSRIQDEDERLVTKQKDVQAKVDEVKGDYRAVEAHTKELGGIAKRRNTLEAEIAPLSAKIDQISQVETQVDTAFNTVVKQEEAAIASFQKEGGDLKNKIATLEAQRRGLTEELDPDLLSRYEKTAKRTGGIALSKLQGNSCNVCRNILPEGRLLQAKAEAPLTECPQCKRMMVVE